MTRVNEIEMYVCDKCGAYSTSEYAIDIYVYDCEHSVEKARFIRASDEYIEPVIFQAEPPAEIVEAVARWLSTCAQSDDDLITRCIQAWPNVAIGDLVRAVSRARDLTATGEYK